MLQHSLQTDSLLRTNPYLPEVLFLFYYVFINYYQLIRQFYPIFPFRYELYHAYAYNQNHNVVSECQVYLPRIHL